MATRALQQVIYYVAWNTSTSAYVTGDSANHTLYWTKDGTASAATNAAAEVDSTHVPGLYKCTMTATETDCIEGALGGKSSTSNVILIPTKVAFVYLNTSAPATAGIPDVNVKNYNNQTAATDTNNLPKVDVEYWRASQPQLLNSGSVQADVEEWLGNAVEQGPTSRRPMVEWVPSGLNFTSAGALVTAQAGANGSITLNAAASATDNLYRGCVIGIVGGTGAGQARMCTGYTGSTKVATVSPNWTTNPASGSIYIVYAFGQADVETWLNTAVTAATAGIPDVNIKNANNHAVATDANNFLEVDIEDVRGATINALQSGRVDAYVGAVASGVIAAASFAANALDAVWSTATRTLTSATNITSTGGTTVPQTGDAYARLGAPAGASIAADIAEIEGETDSIISTLSSLFTTALTEAYSALHAAPTVAQLLFEIRAKLFERSVSGTTETIKKIDGSTTAMTETLNDAVDPTSVTRAT